MAAWQVLFGEACEHGAVEFHHFVAEAFEDTAHDVVTSGVDFHAYFAHCEVVFHVAYFIHLYRAIFEHEAILNLLEVAVSQRLVECDVIQFLDFVAWVSEGLGQFAVVGEEEKAEGVTVEAADWVDTFRACAFDEVHHGMAFVRIVACGDDAFRFV